MGVMQAAVILVVTVAVMLMRPIGRISILLADSVVGVVRQRWLAFAFK